MNRIIDIEKWRIRRARGDDNKSLLALTSQTHMDGNIALRIDRQPDFFSLLKQRGESDTLVCESNNEIIGCVSVTKSEAYINGKVNDLYYLSDLKIARAYQGNRLALALTKELKKYLESIDADLLFMVIADGNHRMRPYVTGTGDLPGFESVGTFKVFQFFPSNKTTKRENYQIKKFSPEDSHINMVNEFYSKYQLGKVFEPDDSSLFIAINEGETVLAMISIVDMSSHKQNVVMEASGWLRGLLHLSKWTHFVNLPSLGEPVKILYINNFYYKQDYKELIKLLMDWAKNYCRKKNFHFLSFGLHECDPLIKILDSGLKITFRSHGYVTSLHGNQEKLNQITSGLVYEDYSLV